MRVGLKTFYLVVLRQMSRTPQFSVSWEEFIDNLIEENKKLREENEMLRCNKGWTPEKVWHEEFIQYLMEENKKLKSDLHFARNMLDNVGAEYDSLQNVIGKLEEENKKLKETIKDHQLYEEKLEHRIIEFEELLHWD